MNESIWNDAESFPAVRELDRPYLEHAAEQTALALLSHEYALALIEPGDATRYELAIVTGPQIGAPYRFASSFGPLYPWMGNPTIHPDYAEEHYVANRSRWTATVYALFLNEVSTNLRRNRG